MTSSSAWKKMERFWARLHGTERSGPKGTNHPDFVARTPDPSSGLAVECKLQKKRCLKTKDIEQAARNAARVGLPWVLILHEKGREHLKHDLIIMPPDTYLRLLTHQIWLSERAIETIADVHTTPTTSRKDAA